MTDDEVSEPEVIVAQLRAVSNSSILGYLCKAAADTIEGLDEAWQERNDAALMAFAKSKALEADVKRLREAGAKVCEWALVNGHDLRDEIRKLAVAIDRTGDAS